MFEIEVYDKKTGKRVDADDVALKYQEMCEGLCYCDVEGFALGECGELYILDECGAYVSIPRSKFRINVTIGDDVIELG